MGILDNELKHDMLNLFYGVYNNNSEIASSAFLKIGKLRKEDINIGKFRRDVDTLITQQRYNFGERQSDNYAKLALKYSMSLPSEFSILQRSLLLIEGVCFDLDPQFNLFNTAKPVISKALWSRSSPIKNIEMFALEGDRYFDIIRDFPNGVHDVIDTIRGYKFEKLEQQTYKYKKVKFFDCLSKNIFLIVIAIISTYLIVNGEVITC